MISANKVQYLRKTESVELIRDYGGFSRGQFSRDGVPVVIAARNEEVDLPATLLSLADSREPVRPIVVENGSTDRTHEFAEAMGAIVLSGATHKMDALHMGVDYVLSDSEAGRSILFTDADTLAGPHWAGRMKLDGSEAQPSEVRYGSIVCAHGEAAHVDAVRTAYAFVRDINNLVRRKRPVGRGANMSLYFSEEDNFQSEYMHLPSDLFIAEEERISDLIEQQGGRVSRALGLQALVVTRGDRYDSLRTLFRLTGSGGVKERVAQYARDYGDFTPHDLK